MNRKSEEIIEETEEEQETAGFSWLSSVTGVVFIALAVVIVGVYFAGDFVPALNFGKVILKLSLGKCWPILVIFLVIVGTNILSNDEYECFSLRNLFLLFCFMTIPALVHHLNVPVGQELFPDVLRAAEGGGVLGGLVVLILHKVFEPNVVLIILSLVLFFSFVCLLPYKDILKLLVWPFAMLKKIIFGEKNSSADTDDEEEDDEEDDDTEEEEKERIKVNFPVQAVEKRNGNEDFLSARSIIASRKDRVTTPEKREEPSVVEQIYNRKEFRGFSDGVRKENILKRIMSRRSKDNVYNQPGIRDNLRENPMEIPNWQGATEGAVFAGKPLPEDSGSEEKLVSVDSKEQKIIPLFGDKTVHDEQAEGEKESLTITHYRENEVGDVEVADDDSNDLTSAAAKPRLARIRYKYPMIDLLDKPKHLNSSVYERDIQKQCEVLKQTLQDFSVNAKIVGVTRGPSITRFEIAPAPGVKVSSITSLADDIALNLAAGSVRIEAPIPGKAAIGIEVPNIQNDAVYFREIVDTDEVKDNNSPLCIGLGKDISGNVITIDITKMPHLLVAGSTGSGKSVCINTLISGILYKAHPEEVKLILVDPKVVELSNYNGIPHLLTPVVTDMKKAASALQWARKEMERRYQLFAENHAREIFSYNLGAKEKLSYIVIIIDELSDLMMVARIDVEDAILALAQKARAAGIHLVLATQRPSVDVITGVIKANIPSRISFAVSSQTDSRTILDMGGAEKLIGKGDMLYYPIGFNKPVRVQGAFISDGEINRITNFVVDQHYVSDFVEEVTNQILPSGMNKQGVGIDNKQDDDIFLDVLRLVMDTGQVSASMLQRKFRVGYTRAARLVDTLEEMGIVGKVSGSKPRELIVSQEELKSRFFKE